MACFIILCSAAPLATSVAEKTQAGTVQQDALASCDQEDVPTAAEYADLEEGSYDPTTVIVKCSESATASAVMSELEGVACVDAEATKDAGELEPSSLEDGYVSVQLEDGADVSTAIAQLDAGSAVEYAQPNYVYRLVDEEEDESAASEAATKQSTLVNDPATKSNSTSKITKGQAWHLKRIGAYDAWDIAKANHQVTVAVLDTGCAVKHEDLADNVLSDYAWDAYRNQKLTKDYDGHGTHCAGLIAAVANNDTGTAGTSYNANIVPVQVFEPGGNGSDYSDAYDASTATLIKAYDYVVSLAQKHPELGLHVVSMSLGGASQKGADRAFESSIKKGRDAGIVTVCAAGNGDGNGGTDESYTVPSDFDECYSVTALSTDGATPAAWSSRNQYKDICAPGENIYSTLSNSNKTYGYMSGTSMATPIVAGCFALLWAVQPSLTVDEATAAVTSTADTENFKPQVESYYGAGVIDIAAAVEKVAPLYIEDPGVEIYSGQKVTLKCGSSGEDELGQVEWGVESGTGTARIDASTGELEALMPGTVSVTASANEGKRTKTRELEILPIVMDAAPTAADTRSGVTVSWKASALAAGYILQRAKGSDGEFEDIATLGADVTKYTDAKVETATLYRYRILPFSAVSQAGTGTASDACSCLHLDSTSTVSGAKSADVVNASFELAADWSEAKGEAVGSVVLLGEHANSVQVLTAASIAGASNGLIVTCVGGELSDDDAERIAKLGPKRVFAFGDTDEVSEAAYVKAKGSTAKFSRRFTSAYATIAAAAMKECASLDWGEEVVICSPDTAAEALAVAGYVYAAKAPVVFTSVGGKTLSTDAQDVLEFNELKRAYIVGDASHVSSAVSDAARGKSLSVTRWPSGAVAAGAACNAQGLESGLLNMGGLALVNEGDCAGTLAAINVVARQSAPVVTVSGNHATDATCLVPLMSRLGSGTATYLCAQSSKLSTLESALGSVYDKTAYKADLSNASVSGISGKVYNGKSQTQGKLKVVVAGKTLEYGVDYKVTYSSNRNIGTASVKVTGIGLCKGSTSRSFTICPASTKVGKLQAKKRAVKVTWGNRAQTSGYQLRYSTASSMKRAKLKSIAGGSSKSKTIKKLKSKKRYYFQVRCYKKVGGKTYYSSWSSKKKVKVK